MKFNTKMSRKQFIESKGATCRNWQWSWGFVNHSDKFVIFGAWDKHQDSKGYVILGTEWKISHKGRKQPAYSSAREYIRLIEEEGYKLKIFPMKYGLKDENDKTSPTKIKRFTPILMDKELKRIENKWYACD